MKQMQTSHSIDRVLNRSYMDAEAIKALQRAYRDARSKEMQRYSKRAVRNPNYRDAETEDRFNATRLKAT